MKINQICEECLAVINSIIQQNFNDVTDFIEIVILENRIMIAHKRLEQQAISIRLEEFNRQYVRFNQAFYNLDNLIDYCWLRDKLISAFNNAVAQRFNIIFPTCSIIYLVPKSVDFMITNLFY